MATSGDHNLAVDSRTQLAGRPCRRAVTLLRRPDYVETAILIVRGVRHAPWGFEPAR